MHVDISLGKKEKTWSFLFESKAARDAWILGMSYYSIIFRLEIFARKLGPNSRFISDFVEAKSNAKALKSQTMKYLPDKRKPVEENLSPRQKEKAEREKEEKERKEKERAEKEKKEREEKDLKEKEKKEKEKRNTKDKDVGVAEGFRRQSVGAWKSLKNMINNDKT